IPNIRSRFKGATAAVRREVIVSDGLSLDRGGRFGQAEPPPERLAILAARFSLMLFWGFFLSALLLPLSFDLPIAPPRGTCRARRGARAAVRSLGELPGC